MAFGELGSGGLVDNSIPLPPVVDYARGTNVKIPGVNAPSAPTATGGGINAANFQWGPGNQFAYDPTSNRYYMGGSGNVAWGNTPNSGDPHGVGSIGSTMYTTNDISNNAYKNWVAQNGGTHILGSQPNVFNDHSGTDFSGISGLTPEQQKLFGPGIGIQSWDASLGNPKPVTVKQVPEESFWSQLNGGTNDPNSAFGGKPWWGGSPLAAFAGAAGGFAAGAGGAMGAPTSAIGGVEGAGALGGSVTGAGGSALSFSDMLPNWLQNAGSGGTSGTSWMDSLKNFFSSGSGTDASWGVNPTGGGMDEFGNFDFGNGPTGTDPFTGGSPWDTGPLMPPADPSGMNPNMTETGTPNWDPTRPDPSLIQQLIQSGGSNAGSIIRALTGSGGGIGSLGALLGALAGRAGANSRPAGNITSVQDIPDYLKPYQNMNLTSGVNNFGVAGQGVGLLPGAQQQLQNTINGQYLDPNTNPAFAPYANDLMGRAGSNFNSLYGKSPDNLNNSAYQENYTRAITNAALPLYNSAYQTERGNQINAATGAPGFASNYAGAALAPNLAFKNLYTGPQATTQPYFTNPGAGALSGALAGGYLANSIFGGK